MRVPQTPVKRWRSALFVATPSSQAAGLPNWCVVDSDLMVVQAPGWNAAACEQSAALLARGAVGVFMFAL